MGERELAAALFRTPQTRDRRATRTLHATAAGDSAGGRVSVVADWTVEGGSGLQAVSLPCVPSVAEGDEVIVTLSGGKPCVTGVVGWGDGVQAAQSVASLDIAGVSQRVDEVNGSLTDSILLKQREIEALQDDVANVGAEADAASERVGVIEASFRRTADAGGNPVLELSTTANGMAARLTNDRLEFRDGGVTVAYVGSQKLYISQAEVTDRLDMGGYAWVPRTGGHLSLVYMGGD